MKYFEPVAAPPEKPDPWWKRLAAYLILCFLIPALGAGSVLMVAILLVSSRGFRWVVRDVPVERQDFWVLAAIAAGAVCGFVLSLIYCIREERRHGERVRTRGFR